jgi:hypothetical protein
MADGNVRQVKQATPEYMYFATAKSLFRHLILSSGMENTYTKRIKLMELPARAVDWVIGILDAAAV